MERWIALRPHEVRGVLSGRQTQLRRVVTPQPVKSDGWVGGHYWERRRATMWKPSECWSIRDLPQFCPYGKPGDRLWVREAWRLREIGEDWSRDCGTGVAYRATDPDGRAEKWRSSLHMPRWASRITLEVTGVRVERLQDISHDDACAEGIESTRGGALACIERYRRLWESINGPGSWDANPWVWAVSFKRL